MLTFFRVLRWVFRRPLRRTLRRGVSLRFRRRLDCLSVLRFAARLNRRSRPGLSLTGLSLTGLGLTGLGYMGLSLMRLGYTGLSRVGLRRVL